MCVEEKSDAGGTKLVEEASSLKNEALTNGFGVGNVNDSTDPNSGENKGLRTYKRRRLDRSRSESKVPEDSCLVDPVYDRSDFDRPISNSQEGVLPNGTPFTDICHQGVDTSVPLKESKSETVTAACELVLSKLVASVRFASLSKLLSENFQGIKAENFQPFSLVNSKVKDGFYDRSPVLFFSDTEEVWQKLQFIGNEMISLAKSLSEISRIYCCEQGCARESEPRTKSEKPSSYGVDGISTCRHCGENADGRDCLVCDHCEDMYHITCIKPAIKEIPQKNWYCTNCSSRGVGSPHDNCLVCERLNNPKGPTDNTAAEISPACEETFTESKENSQCSFDSESLNSEGNEKSDLCTICANSVQNSGRFLTCGHPYCPHKYYHVRCLPMKQLTVYGPQWYCPSCLCRYCLTDKDDSQIVLCDGCDDAYHIYCLEPPLAKVPSGSWFCSKCGTAIQRIQRAKSAYEDFVRTKKEKGIAGRKAIGNCENILNEKHTDESGQGRGAMDMLLNAVKTLNHRERSGANRIED